MSDIIPNYNELQPFRFWCQTVLPAVYDDSLSYYELLNKVVAYLNDMGVNVSALHDALAEYKAWWDNLDIDVAEEVDKRVQQDLEPTVKRQLDEMADNGTLGGLVNSELFVQINGQVNTNTSQIAGLARGKIGSDWTDCISYDMLKQDVRTAMTGGSVAVVGTNAVGTANIIGMSVTTPKLSRSACTSYVYWGKVIVDRTTKKITFKTSTTFLVCFSNLIANLRTYRDDEDTVVDYSSLGENIWGYIGLSFYGNTASITLEPNTNTTSKYYIAYLFNDEYIPTIPTKHMVVEYANETVPNKTLGLPVECRGNRIICDFVQNKITMPRSNNLYVNIAGNYKNINTTVAGSDDYQDDLTMSQTFGCLVYDFSDGTLKTVASNSNISENYFILGYWFKTRNICNFAIPYSVISSPSNWYNVSPEIPVVGDSIVAGVGASNNRCFEFVCWENYGIRLLNYGIGGTGYAHNITGTHTKGNGTVNAATTTTLTGNNTFKDNAVDLITNGKITDCVIFFGGSNDWSADENVLEQVAISGYLPSSTPGGDPVPINKPYSASYKTKVTDTFKTCLDAGARVGVILPLRRGTTGTDYQLPTNSVDYYAADPEHGGYLIKTTVEYTLKDYVDIIAEVCEELGLPCLDMYNSCINPNISALRTKYFDDNAHPNSAGYEQIAIAVSDFAKRWFANSYSS